MNEEQGQAGDEAAPGGPQGPVGGQRLAAARREKKISVLEVAKELHIDEPKVRALESNDFALLGAPVFAKGHLRKYAELVGVDVNDLMSDYYQLTRSDGMPPIIAGRPRVRREVSPGPWIAAIILLFAAAAAYWWFTEGGVTALTTTPASQPEPRVVTEPAAGPASVDPEPVSNEPGSVAPAGVESDSPAPSAAAEAAAIEVEEDAEPPREEAPALAAATPAAAIDRGSDDSQLRLTISYSGDCWTEISDASGRRLFFDMGRDGQTVDLNGLPPISALFGNGNNVSLLVNGSEYQLPSANSINQTVRLTLASPR